ncbi:uncharacterized protein LOC113505341 [Trichoplusia ni]|uniref:Gustatory receptor n=1 Tax=Trichoplusia ni TaxID=7111 RepID=A0A7E5WSJ1_TRINI|nr:uncharacterized protein LOC113505341 [Trichoplusia ni]
MSEEVENRVCNKKTMNSIISTVKPELILEYCFGIYRFQQVDEELRSASWKYKALGSCIILMYLSIFFPYIKYPTIEQIGDFVGMMEEFPTAVVFLQYITTALTASFYYSKINIRIFTSLLKLDTDLQIATSTDFYKQLRSRLIFCLILLVISHFITTVVDLISINDVVYGIIVSPLYFMQRLQAFIFCVYVYMLQCRLQVINNFLRVFIREQRKMIKPIFTIKKKSVIPEPSLNFIGRPSTENMKVQSLASMYESVGNICYMINEVFNYQIFMTLVSTFVYTVVTIWTAIYLLRKPHNINQLINIGIWCSSMISNIVIMAFTCERLLSVRTKTKVLVNKLIMNYDLPKTMRVQAKAFMELVEVWPLRIYIYDMFSVDITLMLKFISVSTTYLIVIVQVSHFL